MLRVRKGRIEVNFWNDELWRRLPSLPEGYFYDNDTRFFRIIKLEDNSFVGGEDNFICLRGAWNSDDVACQESALEMLAEEAWEESGKKKRKKKRVV